MKKDTFVYPAVFTYEEDAIAVTFPDFELATDGHDDADALEMAKDALGGRIWCMEDDNEELPKPTPLKDVVLEDGERAVLVEVFMPTIRMAQVNRSVNRTVTLPAWLNSQALDKGLNFSQVLQEALVSHLGIDRNP
jgi:predicted RNase H-like HicB family nuclease